MCLTKDGVWPGFYSQVGVSCKNTTWMDSWYVISAAFTRVNCRNLNWKCVCVFFCVSICLLITRSALFEADDSLECCPWLHGLMKSTPDRVNPAQPMTNYWFCQLLAVLHWQASFSAVARRKSKSVRTSSVWAEITLEAEASLHTFL